MTISQKPEILLLKKFLTKHEVKFAFFLLCQAFIRLISKTRVIFPQMRIGLYIGRSFFLIS
jgi:hypothetical protein